jgi:5'-nucleotidase
VRVLVTNDDGIDAPGIHALAEAMDELGEVRVIAPARNQSAVGRGLSYGRMGPDRNNEGETGLGDGEEEPYTVTIPREDHELGDAVHGTPCDCTILGVGTFDPDVVVAGCNPGANLGAHVLPRSGTASAATEAACLGVPGVAVSMDVLGMDRSALSTADFERACAVAASVVERAVGSDTFDAVDYLNLNLPRPDRDLAGMALTRPTEEYDMHARLEDGQYRLHNPLWAGMSAGDVPDPEGTDRRALLDDRVSLSPLSLPYARTDDSVLDRLAEVFEGALDGL